MPIVPDTEHIEIPMLLTEKKSQIAKKYGLSDDLATQVVKKSLDIEYLTQKYPAIEPVFLAEYFLNYEKEIKRRFSVDVDVTVYEKELLPRVNAKHLPKEAVLELIVDLAKGKKINYDVFKVNEADIEKEIKKIIDAHPNLNTQALMGEIMKSLRGRVEGKKIMEILKKHKKE
jgi:glutamyl-tRNA(Gln) amidotransferase subunit E